MVIPLVDNEEIIQFADEVDTQIKAIQASSKGKGFALFKEAVDKKPEYSKLRNFGNYVTLNDKRNKLLGLQEKANNNKADKVDKADKADSKQFLKLKSECQNFLDAAKIYLSDFETDLFVGKKWFVYFLYVKEDAEPQLARTVLRIPVKGEVDFNNIQDGLNPNYNGNYEYVHKKVLFFNLYSTNEDRKVHLKVECKRTDAEIMIGSYITYEFDHIVTGTVVFHAIKSGIPDTDVAPAIFPFASKENSSNIPWPIQQFLSLKAINYHKSPNNITEINHLKEPKIDFSYSRKFLELERPIAFIATPESSLSKDKSALKDKILTGMVNKLKKRFKTIDFIYSPKLESPKDSSKSITHIYLEMLRQTRFFILVNTEMDIASFSFVQFGWALSHCKYIIVVYKNDSLSSRIISMDKLGVMFYPFDDLESKKDDIYKYIVETIGSNLPKQ